MKSSQKLNEYRAELTRIGTPPIRELLRWLDLWTEEYDNLVTKVSAVPDILKYIQSQIDILNTKPQGMQVRAMLRAYIDVYRHIKEVL